MGAGTEAKGKMGSEDVGALVVAFARAEGTIKKSSEEESSSGKG